MVCFAEDECSDWLRARGIIESPYGKEEPLKCDYLQFAPPEKPGPIMAFTRRLFDAFGGFRGALLQFTDWGLYQEDEMELILSVRRCRGEKRWLIDAPGHYFTSTEQNEAIAHSYLAILFG
jgi:hypothetical protein